MRVIETLIKDIPLPRMVKVQQDFYAPEILEVDKAVHDAIKEAGVLSRITEGDRVAIAVGSRGVADIPILTREVVNAVKSVGGLPFIVPAMGSHGGATAEGQRDVLEKLGVIEEFIGAPIISTMDVVELGRLPKGLPIYIDKNAYEADKIIFIARIKPHTAFRGTHESGLAKMITIGLGKQKGADAAHSYSFKYMAEHVPAMARITLANAPIIFGLGTIENAYDRPAKIIAVPAEKIVEVEPELLLEAKSLMPRLMFNPIDVLVVDELGKDISGSGMDPHITGRYPTPYATGDQKTSKIIVLDLTEQTHHNANGIGLADITTRKVFEKTAWDKGFANALTSLVTDVVKFPMFMNTPESAVKAGIKTSALFDPSKVRLVRIKNTLHIKEIYISESLLAEAKQNENIKILGEPHIINW
ncbi:lactate racemase domain-containing protein [Oceanobacillus sp. FSL K6-0127]|uniref:lactate racemase domain-containing protein n=1 Tax=Oceanobacillus sp. FSL K6-0127 TaxID=2921420 RepID=UPI0030EB8135